LKKDKVFTDKDQFPETVPRLPIRQVREPYTPQQEVMTERVPR
jgi:hypothetical protein